MRHSPLLLLLLAVPVTNAAAQAPAPPPSTWPVAVGDRVRIGLPPGGNDEHRPFLFAPSRENLDGRVVRQTSDSLYVRQHPDLMPVAVSQASARTLYVTRGRSRTRSAMRNAIFGAIAGVTLAYVAQRGPSSEQSRVDFYAPPAAGGAALGIVHGVLSPTEFWRRVR